MGNGLYAFKISPIESRWPKADSTTCVSLFNLFFPEETASQFWSYACFG